MLAGGFVALVVAQFLPTEPARAEGLPVWVRIAAGVLVLLGVGAVVMPLWRARRGSPWTGSRVAFGLVAVSLGAWAGYATFIDIRSGLPGPAIPLLAVGCVAVLVAAVLLAVGPRAEERGFTARQALPVAVGVVAVAVVAAAVEVVAPWIPVDATTAGRADPAAVPDRPGGVLWASTWSLPRRSRDYVDSIEVVAAGAGVVVEHDDRIVAIDGSTGEERWHYRRAGASVSSIAASPDGRTVVATISPRKRGLTRSVLFAFDANTGEVRWSRQMGWWGAVTDHTLVDVRLDGSISITGVDLGSGEDIWHQRLPRDCELKGFPDRGPDVVLIPVICGWQPATRSFALIGLDDRTGTPRWRHTGPSVTRRSPEDAEITVSTDGRAAAFKPGRQEGDTHPDPVLLESATGTVLHRTDGDIVGPDLRTPVLRREVPGAAAQLTVRDLSTGAEHPLASTCPALERPDQPGRLDEHSSRVRAMVTPTSVIVLCFEGRRKATPRASIDVHARSDGSTTTTLATTETVGPITDASRITGPIPAPGAVVLVVQDRGAASAKVVGLA